MNGQSDYLFRPWLKAERILTKRRGRMGVTIIRLGAASSIIALLGTVEPTDEATHCAGDSTARELLSKKEKYKKRG